MRSNCPDCFEPMSPAAAREIGVCSDCMDGKPVWRRTTSSRKSDEVLAAVRAHAAHGFAWETPAGILCDPPVVYPPWATEPMVARALMQLRKEGLAHYQHPAGRFSGLDGDPGGWSSTKRADPVS